MAGYPVAVEGGGGSGSSTSSVNGGGEPLQAQRSVGGGRLWRVGEILEGGGERCAASPQSRIDICMLHFPTFRAAAEN